MRPYGENHSLMSSLSCSKKSSFSLPSSFSSSGVEICVDDWFGGSGRLERNKMCVGSVKVIISPFILDIGVLSKGDIISEGNGKEDDDGVLGNRISLHLSRGEKYWNDLKPLWRAESLFFLLLRMLNRVKRFSNS